MDALRGLTAHAERLGKDLVDRRAALVQTAEDRAAAEVHLFRRPAWAAPHACMCLNRPAQACQGCLRPALEACSGVLQAALERAAKHFRVLKGDAHGG